MLRILEWLTKFLDTWGLRLLPNPFDDAAQAGYAPANYDAKTYRAIAAIRAGLVGIKKDCVFVDVSRWQGKIDFAKLKAAGVRGVILKCGQGTALDPMFKTNYALAKAVGLLVGCYWFYDSRIDPRRQASLWAATVLLYPCELPCFLDYEEKYGGDFAGINHFLTFLQEFQKLSKLPDSKIGIYTGYFYWHSYGSTDSFWTRYWLWIAWYGNEYDVILPKPWTQDRLFGWQFTSSGDGKLYGVESLEIDLNFFTKGLVIFEALFGETGETPPPSTGDEGMYKVYSETYTMILRDAPNGNRVESHPKGTVFICDRINIAPTSGGVAGDKWAHVVEIGGIRKDLYVAQVHLGDFYCKAEPISTPPAGQNPVATVIFTDEQGKVWGAENVELKPK